MINKIDKQLKLLFVHSSDEMYGADLILLELIKALILNHEVHCTVVLPTDLPYEGKLSAVLEENGVDVIKMDLAVIRRRYFSGLGLIRFLFKSISSVLQIRKIIKNRGIDLVHNNTLAVLPGVIAAGISSVPSVWHVHEIIVKPKAVWKTTSLLAAKLSTKNICVSKQTMDHLCRGHVGNLPKTSVIYNGLNLDRFNVSEKARASVRQQWGIASDEIVVGMVGRVSKWKGQDYFVAVANKLLKSMTNVRFVMVGSAPPGEEFLMEDLQRKIHESNNKDAFIVNEFRDDIPRVLAAFDIFVLPSTQPDPLPTVVLEAMASAKPVVANAHGGSVEMVDEGVSGFLAVPDNADQIAGLIMRLLTNETLRLQMGVQARQRIEQLFSQESHVNNWLNLYNSLL